MFLFSYSFPACQKKSSRSAGLAGSRAGATPLKGKDGPRKANLRFSFRERRGSLLLEAILAIAVFAMFLAGIGFSLVLGESSTLFGGDRTRAAFLAEQQLEAVRSIRNINFSNVTTGTHGLVRSPTGWALVGTSALVNGYRTNVNVISKSTDWLEITSNVSWSFGQSRTGSSSLSTYITNWRQTLPVGNWAAMSRIAKADLPGTPTLQKIAVGGNYAYLTGSAASGGNGLYVYDITNPAAPVRVASSFSLGYSAFEAAVDGNRLYLATDDPTREVQVYDISSPTSLSAGNLLGSFDLPGSGKARSIAVYGGTSYIGTLDDPPNNQFYVLQVSQPGAITLLGSLNLTGSVLDISLRENYAYTAGSNNSAELTVIDVTNPAHPVFAPGVGRDLTDVQDAASVLTTGTAALIGRFNGTAIDELTMFSVASSPVPSPPPGPWSLEVGGDVRSLDSTFARYGFVAGNADAAQLRVIDLVKMELSQAPTLKTYDALAAINGIFYDWTHDRLYAVTDSSLMVFAPGS